MSDQTGPAVPINGPIPTDGEYRIVDDTTVELWTDWAGMWDTAYIAANAADAKRYVRENTAREMRTYLAAGESRQRGAIGVFEPFCVSVVALTVEDARIRCAAAQNDLDREHVLVKAIIPVTAFEGRMANLANAYWRARQEPGGTIADEKDRVVDVSPEARALWEQMGPIVEEAANENEATMARCGVPIELARIHASHKDLRLTKDSLRWAGSFPDGASLDQYASPPLRCVEEWTNGARWVWTDDTRLIVTYCEGDVSGQLFFSPEAFAASWAEATEFYKTH
jgi:hypothetical protein